MKNLINVSELEVIAVSDSVRHRLSFEHYDANQWFARLFYGSKSGD